MTGLDYWPLPMFPMITGDGKPAAGHGALARQHGRKVLVDGARAVMHRTVDVRALDCDLRFLRINFTGRPASVFCMLKRRCCRNAAVGKRAGR